MNDREQAKIAAHVAKEFHDDPVGYCHAVLGFDPDAWQSDVMDSVAHSRRTAVRSGHGVGKTRLAASIIHWFISTRSYPRIRCTANTEKQIMSVLWSELGVIHRQAKNRDLFEYSKTSYRLKSAPEVHFAEAIAWSAEKSEAFAGIHSDNVLYIFDEASAIDSIIWEVSQGAMTKQNARWLVLGNPTRNQGKFYECFGRNQWKPGDIDTSLWHTFTISCFESPRVTKEYIDEIKREYGENSDPFRVRVLGLPPLQEDQQFISKSLFDSAANRIVHNSPTAARILGIDVARFGEDRTVFVERQGFVIKHLLTRRGQDTMRTVGDTLRLITDERQAGRPFHSVVIDSVGIGAGVVDRLREQGVEIIACNGGTEPRKPEKYKNLRAELWDSYKEWLKEGKIDPEFEEDSCGIFYSYDSGNRLVMERKEDAKKRGIASPDLADAATLTFYAPSHVPMERLERKPRSIPAWAKGVGVR